MSRTRTLATVLQLAASLDEYPAGGEEQAASFLYRLLAGRPEFMMRSGIVTANAWAHALRFAAGAHHTWEETMGTEDPNWPTFYAAVALAWLDDEVS